MTLIYKNNNPEGNKIGKDYWDVYIMRNNTPGKISHRNVFRLHDTFARFRTGMKFSLRHRSQGEPL